MNATEKSTTCSTAVVAEEDEDEDEPAQQEDPSSPPSPDDRLSEETPSATETETEDDEDDDDEDEDENGFLFEGTYAGTAPRRFEWVMPPVSSSSSSPSAAAAAAAAASSGAPVVTTTITNEDTTDNQQQEEGRRVVHVALESIDEEPPGSVGSGHYLWPGAELMVEYITAGVSPESSSSSPPAPPAPPSSSDVVSIVELGAGCALASLAALQVWQASLQCVVVTDRDPSALERARNNYESTLEGILNASRTEEELNSAINDLASIPLCLELLHWGRRGDEDAVQELLAEHTNSESSRADLILGTDLIYCPEAVEPLLRTASYLMKKAVSAPSPSRIPQPAAAAAKHHHHDDAAAAETVREAIGGGRFWLSQSFAYDEETEALIDSTCDKLGLTRTVLLEKGPGRRVHEFRLQD